MASSDMCGLGADLRFGPTVPPCRREFDFTLLFEDSILSLLPAGLFVVLACARLLALVAGGAPAVARRGRLYGVKLGTCLALLAAQVAVLALQSAPTASTLRTPVTSAAAAVNTAAAILLLLASHFEHLKSCRPSPLLVLFLGLSSLLDAARTRTHWLLGQRAVAGTLLAGVVLKAGLFVAESHGKRELLRSADMREKAAEELAGPVNRTLFRWLNRLFLRGYRELLAPADIAPIDSRLTSEQLRPKFAAIDERARDPAGFSKNGLVILTLQSLGWDFFAPAVAKLFAIAFTFAQPFLVTAVLQHLESDDAPVNNGYGLIGASFFIYVGIAVAQSWYGHQANRMAVLVRGALCTSIFEKLLRLPEGSELESQAITLSINNVERITRNIAFLHDTWAALIETPLATYLVYRQLGPSCLVIFVVIFGSLAAISKIAGGLSNHQQKWLAAVQVRIEATKKMLASLKAVKMLAANDRASAAIKRLRRREMVVARPFRSRIVLTVMFSYTTLTLAPPLVFGIYLTAQGGSSANFDVTRIFTSLVLITLLSNPLISLFQVLPGLAAAHGCFARIQQFLETEELKDPRTVSTLTEKSEGSGGAPVVSLKDASFGWSAGKAGDKAVLSNLSLDVKAGKRIAIMGPVGSGKTLLLKGLLGEVAQLNGSVRVAPGATFAYYSQAPWLENVSARENLTRYGPGGLGKDSESVYDKIAEDCALEDIMALPDYASGLVGSGGALLSGGQRQRLALARAVTLSRDILVLDDPFSALDRRTRWRIAQALLLSQPSHRTVVFATHDEQIASLADEAYRITENGRLERVTLERPDRGGILQLIGSSFEETGTGSDRDTAQDSSGQTSQPRAATTADHTQKSRAAKQKQMGDVAVYADYLRSMGVLNAVTLLALGILSCVFIKIPDLWMQWWTAAAAAGDRRDGYWVGIYATLQVIGLATTSVWIWQLLAKVVPQSGLSLHDRLLETVLKAQYPFISRIDTGTIINRFNQDLMFVDMMLPMDLLNTMAELFSSMIQIIFISIASIHVLSVVPFLFGLLYLIQHFYLRTSKQLRLMDLESKAALHTRIAEASAGSALATIRAHGWTAIIRGRYMGSFDRSQEPTYLLLSIQRWLFLVLNLVVAGLVMIMVGVALSLRGKISSGAVGVAFLNATTLGETMTRLVVSWTGLETSLGAISRISTFEKETPQETTDDGSSRAIGHQQSPDEPPPSWPRRGEVKFENVWGTYQSAAENSSSSSLPPSPQSTDEDPEHPRWSLRGVNLTIQPGERVAVCGRTGSGKSTLLLALLRMVHLPAGTIMVDGVDCSHLRLSTLRRGFHVISQDAFEESGGGGDGDGGDGEDSGAATLRHQLDPESLFSDAQVDEILRACGQGLWDRVEAAGGLGTLKSDISFSAGEAQLLSVARTVLDGTLREGGIVLLDEATSSVDRDTELKIEEIIISRLQNKTVIAVNHRLEAALGYDKIAVMEKGRIIDFGTPGELVQRCDLFAGLRVAK